MASLTMAKSLALAFSCSRLTPVFQVRVPLRRTRNGHPEVVASLYTNEDRSRKLASHLPLITSIAAPTSLCWASAALASNTRESTIVLVQIRKVYLHILGAVKGALELIGVLSDKLFSAILVGLSALTPFFKCIVSVAVQLSNCVVAGLILPIEKFLQSMGFDTRPVAKAFETIFLAVKQASKQIFEALDPVFSNILQTLLAADHLYLLRGAGIILVIYFLVPIIIETLIGTVRGYKGELSALQALDMVLKRGYLLIDVRTEKEKFKSGAPSLPQKAMNSILFVPVEDLSFKFKGQLRDYRKAEAEVAAIKISFLRRINKSSNLVILDRYGDVAKLVARSLTRLGFRNSWVVTDGFDGGRGWVQSRLNTSTRSGIAQLFSPTRLISEGAKRLFPSSRDIDATQSRKPLSECDDE